MIMTREEWERATIGNNSQYVVRHSPEIDEMFRRYLEIRERQLIMELREIWRLLGIDPKIPDRVR